MDKVPYFLLNISDSLVLIVVIFLGVLVSLFKLRTIGKPALLAAAGFALLAVGKLFDIGYGIWVVFVYDPSGHNRDLYDTVYWVKTGIAILITVIGFVLLIAAIASRKPAEQAV